MLTFVINGESHQVTADQFGTLVDVAVRIMRDASRDTGVEFTVGSLHASAPTVVWDPRPTSAQIDVDRAFTQIAARLETGVTMLEEDEDVPEWMTAATANALYQASAWFGDTAIEGLSFLTNGQQRKLTRQTYRTLDRVLHEETDTIGSVVGTLVTATLTRGAHVTVQDEVHNRGVQCFLGKAALREAGQLIGERVTVAGKVRRDYRGRPVRVSSARVDAAPEPTRISVAEMGGAFVGGPDSVSWLREQRGR